MSNVHAFRRSRSGPEAGALPCLPALLGPDAARLLGEGQPLLFDLVRGVGSPCHIVLPGVMGSNIDRLAAAMTYAGVDGSLFFAMKSNRSEAFVEAAAARGIGVDVSSVEELSAALSHGIRGPDLVVTGPDKGAALYVLAARQGATITVDSPAELATLGEVLSGTAVDILLRHRPASECNSRFGMPDEELRWALGELHEQTHLNLAGFSAHLSGYDVMARRDAGIELVRWCRTAREYGLSPGMVDLGGGWPVRYVDELDWRAFVDTEDESHYHAGRSPSESYPYFNSPSGAAALTACLTSPGRFGRTLARHLADEGLRLAVEPGRSLLDQAGLTLIGILGMRDHPRGYGIVTADALSFSISEQWFESEFLPDPILLKGTDGPAGPFVACVAGCSCLDRDMLTWRKIRFPAKPARGDLLVYANTAGYQMDSNESPFHRRPLPQKIAVWGEGGAMGWCLDRLYAARRAERAAAIPPLVEVEP